MLISTKGRYVLRIMIDLAENNDGTLRPLQELADRQDISEKYLEGLILPLSRAGLVTAVRGKGGGYRLSRHPAEYSLGTILRLTEGSLAPVTCVSMNTNPCPRAPSCKTLPLWEDLHQRLDTYFDAISLADLADGSFDFSSIHI
ncbi:MAG: Rrf2 family transcriptional regulator [Clostridia bacterium]|nr:Rrf2 family transcriptional regulator [Clostridia bacterium]